MLSLVAFQCTVLCLWIWLHSITTRRSSARPTAMFWQRGPTRTISSMCFVSRRWIVCSRLSLFFFLILSCHWLRDLGCIILKWCTMMIINDVDQKVVCWCDFAECVFNIIFFVYRKPLLWVVGLLSSVAMCPNCAFALLHGHVCLWCHFTGSSQPLFQSLVLCMSMKECHCVFVQSCRWTTVLSLVVLMPVPLPPVLPYSPVL